MVAGEVKALATQTARATEEIGTQVAAVQSATNQAVIAIGGIGGTIGRLHEIAAAIAAAVEEQHAATAEISRNVQQAAEGTGQVTQYLSQLAGATSRVETISTSVNQASQDLTGQSRRLDDEVGSFIRTIRAG